MSLSAASNIMNQITSKERDVETGLDFFGARYFSGAQGRFTSADPITVTPARVGKMGTFHTYTFYLLYSLGRASNAKKALAIICCRLPVKEIKLPQSKYTQKKVDEWDVPLPSERRWTSGTSPFPSVEVHPITIDVNPSSNRRGVKRSAK